MGSPHWISIMTYSGKPVATAALEQKLWTKFPSKWNIGIILWCSIARLKKNSLFVPISLMLTFERRINVESNRIRLLTRRILPLYVYFGISISSTIHSQPRFPCPARGRTSDNNYPTVHAGCLFGILHPYQTSLIDLIYRRCPENFHQTHARFR